MTSLSYREIGIRDQLLALGKQRRADLISGRRRLANNQQANDLLYQDSFATLIGILCQQWRTKAGTAWEIPWRVHQALGHIDPDRIAQEATIISSRLSSSEDVRPRMIKIVVSAAERVTMCYASNAESIWSNVSSEEITEGILRFHGAGRKISQMAPGVLAAAFNVSVELTGPIAVDSNVRRVFHRLGLIDDSNVSAQQVEKAAQRLNPHAPAELDLGTWVLGAETCTKRHPQCNSCPLRRSCQRVGLP
jgi:endonuclease III